MMGQLFFFLERIVDDNVDHSLIGIVCSSWRMLHTMIRLWWMDDGVMAVVPRDPICVICPTSGSWFDWENRIRNLDSVYLQLYIFLSHDGQTECREHQRPKQQTSTTRRAYNS